MGKSYFECILVVGGSLTTGLLLSIFVTKNLLDNQFPNSSEVSVPSWSVFIFICLFIGMLAHVFYL